MRGLMKKAMDDLYAKYDAVSRLHEARSRCRSAFPSMRLFRTWPVFRHRSFRRGIWSGSRRMSVPNGFGIKNLPTGIQFTGRIWSESKLIAIANAYQQATDWHKKRPKVS